MEGSRAVALAFIGTLAAGPCAAQSTAARPPLVRADVHGTLGWLNAASHLSTQGDDWYNRLLHGAAGVGWYWTDHVKTEVDVGGSTAADLYSYEPVVISGQTTFLSFRRKFHTTTVAATQQYQFFRNAWFHPYVGAGVEVSWDRFERRDEPLFLYDPVTRQPRLRRDSTSHEPDTEVYGRPLGAIGFKAYMTPRGFFRTDLRVGVRNRIDRVLLRFGFGIDF